MAEAALGMSLDDLIKKSKSEGGNKKTGGKRGRGDPQATRSNDTSGFRREGGIRKGGRGQGRSRLQGGGRFREPPKRNLDGAGKWQHDMYFEGPRPRRSYGGGSDLFTLYISNLDYNVSDDDIQELFGDFESVVKCYVNYDKSGRSLGKATVVFRDRAEAAAAKRRYTNMALDGQIMELELVDGAPNRSGPQQLSSGIKLTRRGGGGLAAGGGSRAFRQAFRDAGAGRSASRGRGRGRPSKGRGGGGGGDLDLDAELDTYMQE